MEYSEVRQAALEALRKQPRTQWRQFEMTFGQVAYEFHFVQAPAGLNPTDGQFAERVYAATSSQDKERLREVFWSLLVEGVVIIGMDRSNDAWPWFRVTEYGERVLVAGEIVPHDPDGYLGRVRSECSPFDPIADVYLQESLQCFLRGTYTASAVMLGVATERVFLNLLDSFITSMPASASAKLRQATARQPLLRQWTEFRRRLEGQKSTLRPDLSDSLDTILDGIFALLRTTRNSAGHPTGTRIEREVQFAHLQLFPFFAKRAVALTSHFASQAASRRPSPAAAP